MKPRFAFSKILIIACVLGAFFCAPLAFAKSTASKTVRDYFLLLPHAYFEDHASVKTRNHWLDSRYNIVDIKNDYVFYQRDGAQPSLYVAVFRYHKQATVAVYLEVENESSLDFLRYINGRWKNVTKQVMPVAVKENRRYHIPHRGTTINVSTMNDEHPDQPGKRLYDLIWRKGRFVVRR